MAEHRQKLDPVRVKHRVKTFNPPLVVCACGWHRKENTGMLIERQRDWLLDRYTEHLSEKRQERRGLLELRRLARRAREAA